jgi:predicted AlkP superfamily phosphohydrolase/phosphomutase
METEIPPISSVAWASFMTGVNPGEHGIFGFTDRKPGTYQVYFPNYRHLKVDPLWARISQEGGRCCVLNVPSTYPAHPVNGVLVSGFVAPSLEKAVYPTEAYEYLDNVGYRIDVDAARARESLDSFLEDLHATLEKRREAMLHFYGQEDWDFFMCVFTGTDRLHHFLWRHYVEGNSTYNPEFLAFYRRLDEILGEFVSELRPDTILIMLSDHGFCSIKKEVFPNAILREIGCLSLREKSTNTIADIDPEVTKAYCMDPGRIYLNRRGREPDGIVGPEEAADIQEDIVKVLLSLKDSDGGELVIDRVEKGTELYSGPFVKDGPDLVVVPRPGYDLKGRMSADVFGLPELISGMHTHDDAFVLTVGLERDPPVHIRGLAPLILKTWGN